MSDDDIAFADAVARAVLSRLGDGEPSWQLLAVERYHEPHASPPGLPGPNSLLLTIGSVGESTDAIGVYFSLDVPREQAARVMADQIQDHAIESAGGRALPPCPGHGHPLSAREVDGIASWRCPRDEHHHVEPILPRDR